MSEKNRFKSIIATDRYGVRYVKNFTMWAEGGATLQRWDDNNRKVRTVGLTKYIMQRREKEAEKND